MQGAESPLIPTGTIIHERYLITRIVGQGGMGAVYEAVDQRLGSTVALKQMLVSGPGVATAFEREARILARLRHPSLPRVTDYFVEQSGQFLVMEFIPGSDLAAVLAQRGRPLPIEEVIGWADQVLGALEYLHVQQPPIIHRDIKPQNIKLTPSGEIVLLDFGLAKGLSSTHVQTTGSIFAYTPTYAPLEQVQGSGTTPLSDIYALSGTLHHLLTGTPPPDVLQRVGARASNRPDPLLPASQLNPLVPPALAAWLAQGLAIEAAQRHPSASAMRAVLQRFQAGNIVPATGTTLALHPPQSQTPTPPLAPSVSPSGRRLWPLGIALILLFLIVFAGGIFLFFRPTNSTATNPSPEITSPVLVQVPTELPPRSTASASRPTEVPLLPTELPVLPTVVFLLPTEPPIATSTSTTLNAIVQPSPNLVALPITSPTNIPELSFGSTSPQVPIRVSASGSAPPGFDAGGNRTTFDAVNVADGRTDTAWRVAGDGRNQFVQLEFARLVRVREIQVIPGYAKIDPYDGVDRFRQNRRVRRAQLEFSDGSSYAITFADDRSFQSVQLPAPVITSYVRLLILETTPLPADPNSRDFTPISEIIVFGEAQQ